MDDMLAERLIDFGLIAVCRVFLESGDHVGIKSKGQPAASTGDRDCRFRT
jgi:hypothetical protein